MIQMNQVLVAISISLKSPDWNLGARSRRRRPVHEASSSSRNHSSDRNEVLVPAISSSQKKLLYITYVYERAHLILREKGKFQKNYM